MSRDTPYVPSSKQPVDLTARALVAGVVFGAVFGSANAYLGLKVGLTISTSIPLAVMSVALFGVVGRVFRPSNILECNLSQTTGSAASSIASGVIFTIPALFMWGFDPSLGQVGMLAMLGGLLGILFMIPLRPFLIVKERKTLPYPEGVAAAQVLIASDSGGTQARNVFVGLGVGALFKAAQSFGGLWASKAFVRVPLLDRGQVGLEPMPALLGVGYILGYRIGAIMVAGGLLSSLAVIPLIATFGEAWTAPLFPETEVTIASMSAMDLWSRYVRYIGAGAVAFAGLITVVRSIPTMYNSFRIGIRGFVDRAPVDADRTPRTERDLPMGIVVVGVLAVVAVAALAPGVLGVGASSAARVLGAGIIAVFAFVFVTVASRIVGLVGVTSNPTSGMTIVTLLGTSLVFYALGWVDDVGKATVLTIGTVVCVAASMAGDISQDLKCGHIIGATPWKQQTVELVGACSAAFAVAGAVFLLGKGLQFGSVDLPAPQATLMKTVIEGVLQANLPWGLVAIGAALALVATLLGVPALPFAVGIYLPVHAMMPVFLGGCLRSGVEALAKRNGEDVEERADRGVLLGSGLIAGEGLMGVAVAVFAVWTGAKPEGLAMPWGAPWDQVVAVVAFVALGGFLVRMTRPARGEEGPEPSR